MWKRYNTFNNNHSTRDVNNLRKINNFESFCGDDLIKHEPRLSTNHNRRNLFFFWIRMRWDFFFHICSRKVITTWLVIKYGVNQCVRNVVHCSNDRSLKSCLIRLLLGWRMATVKWAQQFEMWWQTVFIIGSGKNMCQFHKHIIENGNSHKILQSSSPDVAMWAHSVHEFRYCTLETVNRAWGSFNLVRTPRFCKFLPVRLIFNHLVQTRWRWVLQEQILPFYSGAVA